MKRSLLRLTVTSVLVCWALGFATVLTYSRSLTWNEDRARADGVFLAHSLLDGASAADRPEQLVALAPNFKADLALVSLDDVERRTGRRLVPGDSVSHEVDASEAWYFLAFSDGSGALAAGPVNPGVPKGLVPVGFILAIVLVPLIAGFVSMRVERELSKVERASKALAAGQLAARVDNDSGPSNELAASFNEMADRVEQLIRSRDELVQAVSHELGSPLSRLRFQLELLETEGDAEAREQRTAAMTKELDALDELVAELLGYVQSDDMQLDLQRFDPSNTLSDLGELARLDVSVETDVSVDVELPDDASVFADPRLFQRAVENVLRNAVQHATQRVRLELTEDATHVRVAVHDDGPGIPDEVGEKVLAPFVRLEADRPHKTGGVGLGLAIVNRIVHRHGGRISIDRSPLGGAAIATLWPKPKSPST